MKKIYDLLTAVTEHFDTTGFEEAFNAWAGKSTIESFSVNPKLGNVIVVLTPFGEGDYVVLRMFPGGSKWHVSCDMSHGTAAEVFDKLFSYME
jgi:hypothetical protein